MSFTVTSIAGTRYNDTGKSQLLWKDSRSHGSLTVVEVLLVLRFTGHCCHED